MGRDDGKDPHQPDAIADLGDLSASTGLETSRRDFLKITGLAVSAAGLPSGLAGCEVVDEEWSAPLDLNPDFTTVLYRPEDMVALGFSFVNLKVVGAGQLERKNKNAAAYIIVHHQPQHVLERAYWEPLDGIASPPEPPPIPSRLSGRSRVVFKVPSNVTTIDYDSTGLLEALARWEMSVALNATPPDPPPPLFFARPVLSTVSLTAQLGSNLIITPPPPIRTDTVRQAVVVCQEDGLPPPLSPETAITAARNTAAFRLASAVTGYDLFPITLPEITLKPTIPRRPGTGETAIELPFRLLISPNIYNRWAHAALPVKSPRDRVELWHTRLGVRRLDKDGNPLPTDESSSFYRTIRALWTRDGAFDPNNPQAIPGGGGDVPPGMPPGSVNPFRASLAPRTRSDIVHQTSNFTLTVGNKLYRPRAVKVNRLMLTALGGWFDARGDFGDEPPLGLSLWEHKATFGRDHYVKIVYTGVLYPFGHRCVLVTISERKLKREPGDMHPHTGYVRQRSFIVVKQPVMQYEQGRTSPASTVPVLRKNPFVMLHIKTLKTPDLASQDIDGDPIGLNAQAFWPTLPGNQVFRFDCEALDLEGNLVTFTAPAYFVATMGGAASNAQVAGAKAKWNGRNITRVAMNGQRIAYAPSSDGQPDDATFETKSFRFEGADIPQGAAGYQFQFLPVMGDAELRVGAIEALIGGGATPRLGYDDAYVNNGFGGAGNSGEILLKVLDAKPKADFSKKSDRSGGLVAPSMEIGGLSRKMGPVAGDLAGMAAGGFNPNQFFGNIEALLFGCINLFDIIPGGAGKLFEQAPKFIQQTVNQIESFVQEAKQLLGKIQKAVDDGLAAAGALKSAVEAVVADVVAILNDPVSLTNPATHSDLMNDLTALSTAIGNAVAAIPSWPGYGDAQKTELARRAKTVQGLIGNAADFVGILEKVAQGIEAARNLHVRIDWRPGLQQWPGGGPSQAIFLPDDPPNTLLLALDLRGKDLPGQPAGFDLVCALEKFKLQLIAPVTFMKLDFKKVQLKVENGKKPEIDVQFEGFDFGGVLSFVKTLMEVIPMDGFSDPPSVEVSTEGIKAAFNVGLPALSIGVFSLRNISLGAGFHVPFIGMPLTVSFNFCTRENPFELTVWAIGGGGFFGITLYPKGLYMLEAALEFGAGLSLDFGVASGSVEIKAGIYFKMELDNTTLTGYLRIRGQVEVLAIIRASIELYMSLTYESAGNKVVGYASLTIEVEIFFFSISVTISVQKKFAGDSADPTFEEMMGPDLLTGFDPWSEYVDAFAAAA